MPSHRSEIDGASIVLIGKFNPAIFQPAWLGACNLLRKEEVEDAAITMVSPQVTSFSAHWLTIQVLAERFTAITNDPAQYQALRDLVIGVFHLLEHTPFWVMGMNRDMHFKMESEEQYHRLGHLLAPKEIWKEILDTPGLRSLLMQGSLVRENGLSIAHYVRVEPSLRVAPGVFIQHNVEVSMPEATQSDVVAQQTAARRLIEYLGPNWDSVMTRSKEIADHLLALV